jgi:hypothetical protein
VFSAMVQSMTDVAMHRLYATGPTPQREQAPRIDLMLRRLSGTRTG